MDEQVIDEIIDPYMVVSSGMRTPPLRPSRGLIMAHLREFEILQLATAALTEGATGVEPAPTLATRGLVTLVHKFAIDSPDE